MNVWDAVLSLLIFAAVALAAAHIIRVRRSGRSLCGGDCSRCSGPCGFRGGTDSASDKEDMRVIKEANGR